MSITELEYQRASNKPRLVFIKETATIPFALTDAGTKEHPLERIEGFRERAANPEDQRAVFFRTADDLKIAVVKAFNRFKEERTAKGSILSSPSTEWPQDVLAFFSYCREDSDFALRLAEDLKAAGASVWIDQIDIEPGLPWDDAVDDALHECARMLVLLSPVSVKSNNVRDEISFALNNQKRVIPVLYRDCDVPFRLARLQHIDFRTDYARGLKLLLKVLGVEQQVLGPESMPKVSVAPQVVDSATTEKPAGKGEAQVDPNRLGALLRQAEAGNTPAMSELGYMYGTGKGVEEDQQQSFLWYRKAAEAGDVNGMFNVALIYHADGPEKDEGQAVFWYRKAAEAGDRHAMFNLAYMYEHGLGVERDYSQALTWYGKAHERAYGPEVEQTADSLQRVSFLQEESQKALKRQQREKQARAAAAQPRLEEERKRAGQTRLQDKRQAAEQARLEEERKQATERARLQKERKAAEKKSR